MQDKWKKVRKKWTWNTATAVLLISCFALLLLFLGSFPAILGSRVDWLSQHTVFPDYFRKLFYQTGKILPTFAFHLGAGQNMFNFSYYGLLAPWVLLSYCFPFLSMRVFTIIMFALFFLADGVLAFLFLKQHFPLRTALLGSLLFLCSTSLLFHTHRHLMFVSYLPFLFLSLMMIDRYWQKGKLLPFVVMVTLLILTNYYYAVPSLFALGVYVIFQFLQQEKEQKLSCFFQRTFPLFCGVLLAILLTSILLVPTFFAIRSGRSESESIPLSHLFLPSLHMETFFYDCYGLGLSFLMFLSLFCSFFQKKKGPLFLTIFLLILTFSSFFLFLLNGGQYIRGKVLLPFLPLFTYLFCENFPHLTAFKKHRFLLLCLVISVGFCMGYEKATTVFLPLFIVDCFLCLLFLFCPRKYILLVYLVFLALISVENSRDDKLQNVDVLQEKQQVKITNLLKGMQLSPLYRYSVERLVYVNHVFLSNSSTPFVYSSLSNQAYQQFYQNFFHAIPNRNKLMLTSDMNLFYDTLMGVRYRYGDASSFGYRQIEENLYENQFAFPIVYGNSRLLRKEAYDTLSSEEKMEALLVYTVQEGKGKTHFTSQLQQIPFPLLLDEEQKEQLHWQEKEGKIILQPDKKVHFSVKLQEGLQDKIVFLRLQIENETSCQKKDRFIKIAQQTNLITCKNHLYKNENKTFDFLLQEAGDRIDVTVGKGKYVIDKVEVVQIPTQTFQEDVLGKILPENFKVNASFDTMSFDLSMNQDGYFVSSIPYDEGFQLTVDGKEVSLEQVNEAFLGAPLTKGSHHLVLSYVPKGYVVGKIMTGVGIVLFFLLFGKEKFIALRKKRENDRIKEKYQQAR